jgi:molybdopterin-containing oxidoreductase family iron-sulfur binding subunit
MESNQNKPRYGMVIDLDRCNGCGNCTLACAVENNAPPAHKEANERTGITWMRVYKVENDKAFPENRAVYLPLTCQQCDHHTPCESVCPQKAVEYDTETGIVAQIPVRCLGCRYCMTACPYHARYFNWWDPEWPKGMETTLNPDVSTRMRGVVEKCNFCHGRLQAARAKAAVEGRREITDAEYIPACAESCPTNAIHFGNLADANSEISRLSKDKNTFRLLEQLGTEPKVYFRSEQSWVHKKMDTKLTAAVKENVHG